MGLYWVSRILVLSQLLTGVFSACDCSFTTPQQIDPLVSPFAYILGAYDTNGNSCVPDSKFCLLPINSGNSSWGLTGFQLSTLSPAAAGAALVTVTFTNQDGSTIGLYDSSMTDFTTQKDALSNSAIASVRIDYTGFATTDQVKVVGSINRINKLNTATPRPSTAKPTPVPTYQGPLSANPALISDDIFFAIDIGRGTGDQTVFDEMKGVVNSIVAQLAITEDAGSVTQTRITVGPLSPVDGYSVFGNTWETSQSDVTAILNYQKIGKAPSAWTKALQDAFNLTTGPFSLKHVNETAYMNSRRDTTRLYIIVTSADPSDFDYSTYNSSGYKDVDAHPIVLAYKYNGDKLSKLADNGWSYFNMANNSADSINSFINKYLLSGDTTCPVVLDPLSQPTNDGSSLVDMSQLPGHGHSHQTTANYLGPHADETTPAPWTRNDGNKGRYCNFQNSNTYYKQNPGFGIKFTVFYELEPEKDYLRFFDANWVELAAFTGYDISGTNFVYNGGDVRVQFTSDEKNVYGGFEIVAENVALPTTAASAPGK